MFEYCTSEEAGFQRIYFDDLFTERVLHYTGIGRPSPRV